MQLSAEHRTFLAGVSRFNNQFNLVLAGDSSFKLRHSFWSEEEIERAAGIQEEWEIPKALVPFYGDWHTVLCLDPARGVVQLLDDERRVVFTWPTIEVFLRSLSSKPEESVDTSGVIESESWLDI